MNTHSSDLANFHPGKAPGPNALGDLMERRRAAVGKTEEEVASDMGFSSPKVYRLIVTGMMKLPLAKLAMTARALGCPEVDVLRALVTSYFGAELTEAIDKVWGTLALSENERKLIEGYRNLGYELGVEMRVIDSTRLVAVYIA